MSQSSLLQTDNVAAPERSFSTQGAVAPAMRPSIARHSNGSPNATLVQAKSHGTALELPSIVPSGNRSFGYRFLKRTIDVVGSLLLLASLSPIALVTYLWLLISTNGRPLFVQERVGFCGRRFQMYKFRSMEVGADAKKSALMAYNEMGGPAFKMSRDPRVTRVGRFIRKTSLDEFPQFWNVLRGEMSLVGPRPPIPTEVERYERWQMRRLSMKPGITCIWQVSGRNNIDFDTWMKLDLQYIDITPRRDALTDFALVARGSVFRIRTVEGLRQNASHRRFADTASAREQVRVGDSSAGNRISQRLRDVVLADHLGKRLRPEPAGQDRVLCRLDDHTGVEPWPYVLCAGDSHDSCSHGVGGSLVSCPNHNW